MNRISNMPKGQVLQMVTLARDCSVLCPRLHMTECFLNAGAIFSNKQRHFVGPHFSHDFLDQTHTLEERDGVNYNVSPTFVRRYAFRNGDQFITRTVPKDNRQIELLGCFDKVSEDFEASIERPSIAILKIFCPTPNIRCMEDEILLIRFWDMLSH